MAGFLPSSPQPARHTHSTAVEGGRKVQVRYDLSGRMELSEFVAFAVERAAWLGIAGSVAVTGPGQVSVIAAGPEAMVGAFEMALTLGPLTALVIEVRVSELDEAIPNGFTVRDQK